MRELLDADGENRAVRSFLAQFQCGGDSGIKAMKIHLEHSGFNDCWPAWVVGSSGHLTKGGAQSWLRHLFALERVEPIDQRARFEQAAYRHYLERHAAGKTDDMREPAMSREGLLWRQPNGEYGVLLFNASWWAWQEAVRGT